MPGHAPEAHGIGAAESAWAELLLVAERVDRIEACSTSGGVDPEEQAYGSGEPDGQSYGGWRDSCVPVGEV